MKQLKRQNQVKKKYIGPSKNPIAETRYTVEGSDVVYKFLVDSSELSLAEALVERYRIQAQTPYSNKENSGAHRLKKSSRKLKLT